MMSDFDNWMLFFGQNVDFWYSVQTYDGINECHKWQKCNEAGNWKVKIEMQDL